MQAVPRAKRLPQATKDKCRALYLMGNSPTDVAEMLGLQRNTVQQWATRYGWIEEKRLNRTKNTNALNIVHKVSAADVIIEHQKRVAKVYESKIDSLADFIPSTAKEFVDVGQALRHLDDVGRRNLGLSNDNEGARQNFHVHLGNMKFEEHKAVEIDVTPGKNVD